jgi:hypothetical protein
VRIRIPVRLRKVDLDDVVRRARDQRRALVGVDDVIGRGDDGLQPADAVEVVVQRAERLDDGH